MSGSIDEMLEADLGALFMPHGLGHLLVSVCYAYTIPFRVVYHIRSHTPGPWTRCAETM